MLQKYLDEFLSLTTNKHAGAIAPHKPILLLSVIDLFEGGQLKDNHIELTDQLERLFMCNWHQYVGNSLFYRPNIDKPYWHMKNEPFWELVSKSSLPVEAIKSPYSVKTLQENVYAVIDEELVLLLKDPEMREVLRKSLIDKYMGDYLAKRKMIAPIICFASILLNLAS